MFPGLEIWPAKASLEFMDDQILSIIGGIAIGAGAGLLLLTAGRTAGVSGICSGLWFFGDPQWRWRLIFVLGLLCSAVLWAGIWPERFAASSETYWVRALVGGSMVGFGTRLASGCTSGHGVCGVARLSKRSITATCVFLGTAILTVAAVRIFANAA